MAFCPSLFAKLVLLVFSSSTYEFLVSTPPFINHAAGFQSLSSSTFPPPPPSSSCSSNHSIPQVGHNNGLLVAPILLIILQFSFLFCISSWNLFAQKVWLSPPCYTFLSKPQPFTAASHTVFMQLEDDPNYKMTLPRYLDCIYGQCIYLL